MTPWTMVVLALCAFRVTKFVVFDSWAGVRPGEDPLNPAGTQLRKWLDEWAYDETGADRSFVRGKVGDLLTCPFCFGFWACLGTWAAWEHGNEWVQRGVLLFALAGAQSLLSHWGEK